MPQRTSNLEQHDVRSKTDRTGHSTSPAAPLLQGRPARHAGSAPWHAMRTAMRRALRATLLACLLPVAAPAGAQPLRVATWNVEHWMDEARFAQWRAFCEPLQWTDPEPPKMRPPELTYCDALDGADFSGRLVSLPVRDEAAWDAKRRLLAATVARLDADLVAFQEVADAAAVARIVPGGWRIATTAELTRSQPIAQNVGVAIAPRLASRIGRVELVPGLAQAGADGRLTRPGLAVEIDVGGGRRAWLLVVHLKAGCRMGRMDRSGGGRDARSQRRRAACAVLQAQVPVLEGWIDAHVSQTSAVILAGDFNRDLSDERARQWPAHADATGAATAPAAPGLIAALLPEIDDDMPPGARFSVTPTATPAPADCHRGIDHVLVSANATPWMTAPLPAPEVMAIAQDAVRERVRASDHCPHLQVLPF